MKLIVYPQTGIGIYRSFTIRKDLQGTEPGGSEMFRKYARPCTIFRSHHPARHLCVYPLDSTWGSVAATPEEEKTLAKATEIFKDLREYPPTFVPLNLKT